MKLFSKNLRFLLLVVPFALVACGGDNDNDPAPSPTPEASPTPSPDPVVMVEYRVTAVNTTNNQPLSPLATILHDSSYSPWSIGQAASAGLEQLAESGSPTDFIAEATEALGTQAGDGVFGPGSSTSVDITAELQDDIYLTVATMLVNTNDAFTGLSSVMVGQLDVGEYVKMYAPIYDAGTESNYELAGTIPGPADGGEGYNAEREMSDIVTRHPGVVTSDDGYAESVLDESHRFDNNAMMITIERIM